MIWFGWILWHINHCRIFNAKFSLYIYIKYIGFALVGFYGISTTVDYLFNAKFYSHTHTHTHIYIYIRFVMVGWLV